MVVLFHRSGRYEMLDRENKARVVTNTRGEDPSSKTRERNIIGVIYRPNPIWELKVWGVDPISPKLRRR